jgi:phosphoribosylaminoimidazole-succinocarboxamide synthase
MPLAPEVIRRQLDHCLVETDLPHGTRQRGKVRDVYRIDEERVALVTTDRISAFDHVLPQAIPFKGQILNRLAAHFFETTADVIPNHVLSVPDPNVTLARACTPFPVEVVVRGYLAGHAWREYRAGRRILCGAPLADGLRESERLPMPIVTPSTKAAEGHDEDITREQIIDRGLLDRDTYDFVANAALRLFARGTELAASRGLLLVDTKYEFGRTASGEVLLVDEVNTPDSSRYYYADGYEARLAAGEPQRQLSKEFVREWLIAHGFSGASGQQPPDLPDDFRVDVAARYAELFEAVVGRAFEPDTHPEPAARVAAALDAALA